MKGAKKLSLKFLAIYNCLNDNPASVSSPEDWLSNTKQIHFEQTMDIFVFEHA